MKPQIPLDNELVMNFMFMLASLDEHGLVITDMQELHSSVCEMTPFTELRKLFGQTEEPKFQLRIANRDKSKPGEITIHAGTLQSCVDYARNHAMSLLDALGHSFQPTQWKYPCWAGRHYLMYVVPINAKVE
jgi:hypothetical protein